MNLSSILELFDFFDLRFLIDYQLVKERETNKVTILANLFSPILPIFLFK
jgi:hypothetical protein